MRFSSTTSSRWAVVGCIAMLGAEVALAGDPFDTSESEQYLLIARMKMDVGTDVDSQNSELGANKAPVPSPSGGIFTPSLLNTVPDIKCNALVVGSGIGGHGNIAVTDLFGTLKLANVGLYADFGARLAGAGNALNQASNSFFNDPNDFPNTFTLKPSTNPCPAGNNNTQGNGCKLPCDNGPCVLTSCFVGGAPCSVSADCIVNPDPLTAIASPTKAGVTFNFNHAPLLAELAAIKLAIDGLTSIGGCTGPGCTAFTLSPPAGIIQVPTKFGAVSGINLVTVNTGLASKFIIKNTSFVITGPADAFVIFIVPKDILMEVSQATVLVGTGGIGLNNVMFVTFQNSADAHFSITSSVINGVAFWSLGTNGGRISVNQSQGCTQLVADELDMNDSRFFRCAVSTPNLGACCDVAKPESDPEDHLCFNDSSLTQCIDAGGTYLGDGTTCANNVNPEDDCGCDTDPNFCNACVSPGAGNGNQNSITLESAVFDGSQTKFTYRICKVAGTLFGMSHWVLSVPEQCCNAIKAVSGPGGTVTTTVCAKDAGAGGTQTFGIKYDETPEPPLCGVKCDGTGDVYTITFDGFVGTGCIHAATKADGGKNVATACLKGPDCKKGGVCGDGNIDPGETCDGTLEHRPERHCESDITG